MSPMLKPLIGLALAFLGLFGISELLYHKFRVRAEHTRNLVHFVTGLLTLLFPVYLGQLWQVALLCGAFLVILILSMKLGMLQSINAVPRRSQGSWLYPIVVVICYWYAQSVVLDSELRVNPYTAYAVPLLLLALCDPAAAVAGRLYHKRHPEAPARKTLAGSTAFFVIAFAVCASAALIIPAQDPGLRQVLLHAAGIAAVTTAAERWSSGGWDNLTIPLSAIGYFQLANFAQAL